MINVTPEFLREMPLPDPEEADKKTRGSVLIIAGGVQVPGAALLAGTAALRAGAGRLQIATCASNALATGIAIPEALVLGLPETPDGGIDPRAIDSLAPHLKQADAVLIGPGLQDDHAIEGLRSAVLGTIAPELSVVIDARAIKGLSASSPHRARTVLTPHAGEMAGLVGIERSKVEADPAAIASQAAHDFGTIVALKGARTFIASPHEHPVVCREGNVGLATSGSGDVLAGTITGLLARGTRPFEAVCWGVYLHAKAGDKLSRTVGPLGFLARELLLEIPRVMGEISSA